MLVAHRHVGLSRCWRLAALQLDSHIFQLPNACFACAAKTWTSLTQASNTVKTGKQEPHLEEGGPTDLVGPHPICLTQQQQPSVLA
jgi:hypothetical protein